MKHTLKVTIFVEIDTDDPAYPKDHPQDIDALIERAREQFYPLFADDREPVKGALFTGCQVELVE